MVKFINFLTGTAMYVADDRVDEYKAAGYKLAASSAIPAEKAAEKAPAKKPVARKKTTTKK